MEGILTMTQGDLKRLHLIRKAIDKCIKQRQAAEILGLSQRQIRRLVKRVRDESDKGIIHRLRGIRSHRAIPDKIKDRALTLCRSIYAGFNPTLASEKLFENNKIGVSRETLRQWFISSGIAYDARHSRPHRRWRPRREHCGQMLQMDGSHHDWFEGRAKPCVLMGYIDDATSRVYGRFYEYEGTFPAMESFKRYILKYGLPQSVYLDRHSTYKGKGEGTIEDQLLNRQSLSQFGRALEELGVRLIHAHSAPAKGRIERLFKTFQDRLVKEMRLKGVSGIREGNAFLESYLPLFNKRFNVPAANKEDLHRFLPKGTDLKSIFSINSPRVLRNDFTVAHKGVLYQVHDNIRSKEVLIQERLNGSLFITCKGRALRYSRLIQRPQKIKRPRRYFKPPVVMSNPWRTFRLPGSNPAREEVAVGAL